MPFVSLAVFLALLQSPSFGTENQFLETQEVVILFPPSLKGIAEETAHIYPLIKKELQGLFGWDMNFRPTVILVRDRETFQRMSGTPTMVAFAVPDRFLMVIDHSRMGADPFSIEATLKHELCHLLLHHHIRKEVLPKWLDEGIAQWASGGMAEIFMDRKPSLLYEAILSGRHLSIAGLRESFPADERLSLLAYEESKSLVEYMIQQFGMERVVTVLNSLNGGEDLDEAILSGLSITPEELEARWFHHLRKSMTWITYLIHNLYEILFFAASILLVLGYIKRLLKKRASRMEEETGET